MLQVCFSGGREHTALEKYFNLVLFHFLYNAEQTRSSHKVLLEQTLWLLQPL